LDEKTNLNKISLSEIYPKYSAPDGGGDKGTAHTYIEIYEKEMSKTTDISLLEIGVWEGHSLAMWQEYFRDSYILGLDIDLGKVREDLFDINAITADATKPLEMKLGIFDYIIDDGSHNVHDQIASLSLLWDNLASKGKYFIEDIRNSEALAQIKNFLNNREATYRVYDNRHIKNRSDDILLVIDKE
jgi:hypothetical protein